MMGKKRDEAPSDRLDGLSDEIIWALAKRFLLQRFYKIVYKMLKRIGSLTGFPYIYSKKIMKNVFHKF